MSLYIQDHDPSGKIRKVVEVIGSPEPAWIPIPGEIEAGFAREKYLYLNGSFQPAPDWPPSGYIEDPERPGYLRKLFNRDEESARVALLIRSELDRRAETLVSSYAQAIRSSFPTRQTEATEILANPGGDHSGKLLYAVVREQIGKNPETGDLAAEAEAVLAKAAVYYEEMAKLEARQKQLVTELQTLPEEEFVHYSARERW